MINLLYVIPTYCTCVGSTYFIKVDSTYLLCLGTALFNSVSEFKKAPCLLIWFRYSNLYIH